jgi:hypothetical protein
VNESENKQLATNASIDHERMRYVNALFNGTSNTKRKRLYQEFGYPQDLCFDDFYRAYRRNAIAGAAVTRMVDGCWEDYPEVYEGDQTKDATKQTTWDTYTKGQALSIANGRVKVAAGDESVRCYVEEDKSYTTAAGDLLRVVIK